MTAPDAHPPVHADALAVGVVAGNRRPLSQVAAAGLSVQLLVDADEMNGWGAGNEAEHVRQAVDEIATLRARVKVLTEDREELREERDALQTLAIAIGAPEWWDAPGPEVHEAMETAGLLELHEATEAGDGWDVGDTIYRLTDLGRRVLGFDDIAPPVTP